MQILSQNHFIFKKKVNKDIKLLVREEKKKLNNEREKLEKIKNTKRGLLRTMPIELYELDIHYLTQCIIFSRQYLGRADLTKGCFDRLNYENNYNHLTLLLNKLTYSANETFKRKTNSMIFYLEEL